MAEEVLDQIPGGLWSSVVLTRLTGESTSLAGTSKQKSEDGFILTVHDSLAHGIRSHPCWVGVEKCAGAIYIFRSG